MPLPQLAFSRTASLWFSVGTSAASFLASLLVLVPLPFSDDLSFGFSAGTSSAASFFTLLDLVGFSVVFAASVSSSVFAFLDGLSLVFLPHP